MSTQFDVRLFIAEDAEAVSGIARQVRDMLDQALPDRYLLQIIDVVSNPERAEREQVLMTPTLVLRYGHEECRMIGDPTNLAKLRALLPS